MLRGFLIITKIRLCRNQNFINPKPYGKLLDFGQVEVLNFGFSPLLFSLSLSIFIAHFGGNFIKSYNKIFSLETYNPQPRIKSDQKLQTK